MTFTLNGKLYRVLVELSDATLSKECLHWLRENNLSTPPGVSAAIRIVNLESRRNTLAALPRKPLDGRNYLNDQNHGALILFLTDQVPPIIDPLGYEGWDLFFQMLPSWKGYLAQLPEVVASLLANK